MTTTRRGGREGRGGDERNKYWIAALRKVRFRRIDVTADALPILKFIKIHGAICAATSDEAGTRRRSARSRRSRRERCHPFHHPVASAVAISVVVVVSRRRDERRRPRDDGIDGIDDDGDDESPPTSSPRPLAPSRVDDIAVRHPPHLVPLHVRDTLAQEA